MWSRGDTELTHFGGELRVIPPFAFAQQETMLNSQLEVAKRSGNIGKLLEALADNKLFVERFWEQQPFLLTDIRLAQDLLPVEALKAAGLPASTEVWFTKRRGNPNEGVTPVIDRYPPGTTLSKAWIEEELLEGASFVVNGAGTYLRSIAELCLNATLAFQMPANANLYLTAGGVAQPTSGYPHQDRQDVFIVQLAGSKKWRLYEADDMLPKNGQAKGKHGNPLHYKELGVPIRDVTLRPGQLLYLPRGMVHATTTLASTETEEKTERDSLHVTLGLETDVALGTWESAAMCTALYGRIKVANGHWGMLLGDGGEIAAQATKDIAWRHTIPVGFLRKFRRSIDGPLRIHSLTDAELAEQAGQLYNLMKSEGKRLDSLIDLEPEHYVKGVNKTMNNFHELVGAFELMYREVIAGKAKRRPNIDATLRAQAAKLFRSCGAGVNIEVD